jgi:hypothetical protein
MARSVLLAIFAFFAVLAMASAAQGEASVRGAGRKAGEGTLGGSARPRRPALGGVLPPCQPAVALPPPFSLPLSLPSPPGPGLLVELPLAPAGPSQTPPKTIRPRR